MKIRLAWFGAASALLLLFGVLAYVGLQREVVLAFNDREEPIIVKTYGGTLRSVIEEAGLEPEEIAEQYDSDVEWETVIDRDVRVEFKRVYRVMLSDAGETRNYETMKTSVESFLNEQGVEIGALDELNVDPANSLKDGMHIVIDRVEKKHERKKETIPFETKHRKDDRLAKGKQQVSQQGKNGYQIVELVHTFKNGKRVHTEKKVIEEVKPQDKVVLVGTKETPKPDRNRLVASRSASRGSSEARVDEKSRTIAGKPYVKSIRVVATGYTHTGNRTATGTIPRRGTVAVDPRVIPYGTRMYIPGYGEGVARDTGGAIVGNRIDLFYETAREAYAWGMRTVTIYILK